ncbi:DUF554 domain-containing protein [Loigolactobacillus bifermentans]|uniref:Membrane protein n=1 Tax=Loigolactobacillus bifermentans DSM 20003 TaxID=1423726 RepID=A0A0R1H202_9LACO|nr:DUF554 domain-containing protein [Loigolactobacillus bifermentans]KRK40620.1 membrane protein [Loigolactobacillus bifermentans DSM 20003]
MTRIYFVGIGTVVNTGAIVIGGLLGYLFQRLLSEKLQQTLMQAIGVAVLFIGISGTLSRMLVIQHDQISTQGIMMATVSLAIGAILGELIDIEAKFDRLGRWLRQRVGQGNDSKFIDGFVSASLTTCVGAMVIIGPLQDALAHDPTMLFTKALLDAVIVAIYTAAFGLGATFCALPVFVVEIAVTFLAVLINEFLTTPMTNGISLVGSMMIFCIGVNLLFPKKIRVANLLPAIVVVVLYAAVWPN